jgi:thioredoxin reductase (NADPH)
LVLHDGASRASRIPITRNVPGLADGIAGKDLLARMSHQVERCGAVIESARVTNALFEHDRFLLTSLDGKQWSARALILATGVELNQIPLDDKTHEAAIRMGVLRYCPICDGYEHRGQRIAVVGFDASGAAEALFLRRYSTDITLLPSRDVELSAAECANLERAGVATIATPIVHYVPVPDAMQVFLEDGSPPLSFDIMFPGLGVRPRNDLAKKLGLAVNDVGNVSQNAPFGTERPGLFCAGDVVDGLDQISVAIGHGAVAATRAHNWLRTQTDDTRRI